MFGNCLLRGIANRFASEKPRNIKPKVGTKNKQTLVITELHMSPTNRLTVLSVQSSKVLPRRAPEMRSEAESVNPRIAPKRPRVVVKNVRLVSIKFPLSPKSDNVRVNRADKLC